MTDKEKSLQEKMMGPRPNVEGIFRDHNCWKCKNGDKPCVMGNPYQCDYPHARDD